MLAYSSEEGEGKGRGDGTGVGKVVYFGLT